MSPSARLLRSGAIAPEVQAALMPEYAEKLAFNSHLCPEALDTVADPRKLSAAAATKLLGREVTIARLHGWAAKERRSGPLRALMEANATSIDDEFVDTLGKARADVLGAAICGDGVSADKALSLLDRVDPQARLAWLAGSDPKVVGDDDVAAALASYPDWAGDIKARARRSSWCALMIAIRPGLISKLLVTGQHDSMVVAIAGSASLIDEALQHQLFDLCLASPHQYDFAVVALAANPATHQSVRERFCTVGPNKVDPQRLDDAKRFASSAVGPQRVPVSQVCDEDILVKLLRRALPNDYKHLGRPALAWSLCFNDHLDEAHYIELARLVAYCADPSADAHLPRWAAEAAAGHLAGRFPAVDEAFAPAKAPPSASHTAGESGGVDLSQPARVMAWDYNTDITDAVAEALGDDPQAWRVALSLVDEFHGSCEELVATARAAVA